MSEVDQHGKHGIEWVAVRCSCGFRTQIIKGSVVWHQGHGRMELEPEDSPDTLVFPIPPTRTGGEPNEEG